MGSWLNFKEGLTAEKYRRKKHRETQRYSPCSLRKTPVFLCGYKKHNMIDNELTGKIIGTAIES